MTLESFVDAFWCLMFLPMAWLAWVGLARFALYWLTWKEN